MKFDFAHTFKNITLEKYEELFFDEAFNEAMKPVAELKSREMLEKREENGKIIRKIRVVPSRNFPGPVKKLMGDGELSYMEDNSFDKVTHVLDWRSKTSVLTDKIKMSGQIIFSQSPAGVQRRVTGEVSVSVFGLGGMVEKLIVDNIRETYDKIATFTQKWIDGAR